MLQMVPFFQRGTIFSLIIMFVVKRVLFQDRGTIHNNHIYETVPFSHWDTEIVPLRVLFYGQSNSVPRGTVSVPFFSECKEYVFD